MAADDCLESLKNSTFRSVRTIQDVVQFFLWRNSIIKMNCAIKWIFLFWILSPWIFLFWKSQDSNYSQILIYQTYWGLDKHAGKETCKPTGRKEYFLNLKESLLKKGYAGIPSYFMRFACIMCQKKESLNSRWVAWLSKLDIRKVRKK